MCTSWALGVKSLQVEMPTTLIALKLQIASNADGSNLTRLCLVGRAKVEIRFRKAGKGLGRQTKDPSTHQWNPPSAYFHERPVRSLVEETLPRLGRVHSS